MKKKLLILSILFSSIMLVGCNNEAKFSKDTTINDFNVSGMKLESVKENLTNQIKAKNEKTKITLKYDDKSYEIYGKDLQLPNVEQIVQNAYEQTKPKDVFEKIGVKKRDKFVNVRAEDMMQGLNQKIDEITKQIECQPQEPQVVFNPQKETPFEVSSEKMGVSVDKEKLYTLINESLKTGDQVDIEIPVVLTSTETTKDEVLKNLQVRGSFSTNYSSSVDGRKHNVQLALSAFNGLVVEPEQEISFNEIVEKNINDDDFQTAKIILNGQFVDGKGGGICQASTTLYNALLMADLEILEVNPHSLPVGYVYLGFDAMVNRGSSDLRFKNNTAYPIYFKTWGDETDAYVEVYGQPWEDGLSVRRRAEFVGTIPHNGDKIIPDTEGLYKDKITFKGEYYRVKYPCEGYEAKAYIDYLKDGEVLEEKFIRHEKYGPTQGIIYEGTEDLIEGLTLPENDVKYIPPQSQTQTNGETVTEKIQNTNPPKYNP